MPRTAPPNGDFVAAGKGVLDYPHYLAACAAPASTAPLVTHGLTAAEAPEVAAFLRRALAESEARA